MKKLFKNKKNKAIFLDRDGVINKKAKEHEYIKSWGEFEFLPGVAEAIKKLNKNFLVIVVSNQRGVARGLVKSSELENIHKKMQQELKKKGAKIDGVYFCPHDESDNCNCRKPKTGLILKAVEDLNIDVKNSYMVGDSITDIEAGKKAGCKTMFLGQRYSKTNQDVRPDFVLKSISETTKFIEN